MPVIINEIQITAFVNEQNSKQPTAAPSTEKDRQQLIKTCVEEVLRLIKEIKER
jgi:hypothetical protein